MPGLKTRQCFWEAVGRQRGSEGRAARKREKTGKERAEHFAGAAVGRVHAPDKLMFKCTRGGCYNPFDSSGVGAQFWFRKAATE